MRCAGFVLLIVSITTFCFSIFATAAEYSNAEVQEWTAEYSKAKLNTELVLKDLENSAPGVGLEILIAGPGATPETLFGHALVRFVTGKGINDPVFAFVADVDEPGISKQKGLFGGYRLTLLGGTLSQVIQSFALRQKRSLTRFILPSNSVQRWALVEEMKNLWHGSGPLVGSYGWLNRNCGEMLSEALQLAGIVPKSFHVLSPADVSSAMIQNFVSPFPPIEMVEKTSGLENKVDVKMLSTLTLIQLVILNSETIKPAQLSKYKIEVQSRTDEASCLADPFRAKSLPNSFYDELSDHGDSRVSLSGDFWSQQQIGRYCENLSIYLQMDRTKLNAWKRPSAFSRFKTFTNSICYTSRP